MGKLIKFPSKAANRYRLSEAKKDAELNKAIRDMKRWQYLNIIKFFLMIGFVMAAVLLMPFVIRAVGEGLLWILGA